MTTHNKILYIAIICLSFLSFYDWKNKPDNDVTKPPKEPFTQTAPTEEVVCPPDLRIKVIEKQKIIDQLINDQKTLFEKIADLYNKEGKYIPDWLTDKDNVAIADATIPSHKASTYTVAFLNMNTGAGKITYVQEHIPFFSFENNIKANVGYIIVGDKSGKIQGEISYTPFRIGSVYTSGSLQMDDGARVIIKIHSEW